MLGILGLAAGISRADPDLYHRIAQEDEVVEWASFWAFALAAALWGRAARRAGPRSGLFAAGMALFCLFVALEEISWGQRLFGFRPPAYFLEHNFQQELNLHNVVPTEGRKLALVALIAGYGLVLPSLSRVPATRGTLARFGVPASAGRVPAFAALLVAYQVYPWDLTGEWVELGLGSAFLLDAPSASAAGRRTPPAPLLAALAAGLLGAVTAAGTRLVTAGRPESLRAARTEAAALRRDLQAGDVRPGCGLHKRLYTWVREDAPPGLESGAFARLVRRGLPEDRARFFLDPWNSPWWVRQSCDRATGRRVLFVYSFGPDRRRDSDAWEVRGDDVGLVVRREIRSATQAAPAPGGRTRATQAGRSTRSPSSTTTLPPTTTRRIAGTPTRTRSSIRDERSITRSARFPTSRLPTSSSNPSVHAAFSVAAEIASSSDRPMPKQASVMANGIEGDSPPPGFASEARASVTPSSIRARAGA